MDVSHVTSHVISHMLEYVYTVAGYTVVTCIIRTYIQYNMQSLIGQLLFVVHNNNYCGII